MSEKPSFQDIVLRLINFWKDQGCLVWQPYNIQVGAGTNNPATVLRVLGPEPWNIVYVEPSIRPDDARYGDNPNRMQMFYQLQVILQPDPGNPQELYLQSLEAVGIDPRRHDIRFVEDNWASPPLGAWGLGWEVWLDGQEITQYTYFQQAGSINLEPVAVEITYGLDRISLALQAVDTVWDMEFGAGVRYGDVLHRAEYEHSRYYIELADVDMLRQIYDMYEREAQRCIEAGLVIPAHDYNLKCSHVFNVLDTRGAVGVTERANNFRRMRQVSRQIAQLYLAQREELGYPLHQVWPTRAVTTPAKAGALATPAGPATSQPFVLEIGCEELPAGDVTAAAEQLARSVPELLDELRLSYVDLRLLATPRRLAVVVDGLAPRQPDRETEVVGPPADRAFDDEGRPTRAAEGFARSRGVAVTDLRLVGEPDRRYVAAVVRETGRPTPEILAERLPDLLSGISFGQTMRWNDSGVSFSRPIRWLLALYGDQVVPFAYAGLSSGRQTRGLRPHGSPVTTVAEAGAYEAALADLGVMADLAGRREAIRAAATALAAEVEGRIMDPADRLLDEVTNLVEAPTVFRGRFEARYLRLPTPVLATVMQKHQRYFPVYAAAEVGQAPALLPYFIAVRNGDDRHLDQVIYGNEQVIKARFADAEFFHDKDVKQSLSSFLPSLATLTFQEALGSMLDKTRRLEQLAPALARLLHLPDSEQACAARAAAVAKADLASSMVVELTSLQGIMGGYYGRLSGEPEGVARAVEEQYEAVSRTPAGLALALADRLDSLMGLFAVDMAPKGSNDPFALRRAALQVIENLVANQVDVDLRPALEAAGALLPVPSGPETVEAVLDFIAGRLDGLLREAGYSAAVVKAVLGEQAANPFRAHLVAADLDGALQAPDWPRLLDAYARCVRITRNVVVRHQLDPSGLTEPAERDLWQAYEAAAAAQDGSVPALIAAIRALEPAISAFFDDVLVMAEDESLRNNRLALLQRIAALTEGVVDLSQLEGF